MSKRKRYDFERLDKYCTENDVTLLDDYNKIILTKDSLIKGNCVYDNCESPFEKKFCELENTGAYCKICIKKVANKRRKDSCIKKYGFEFSSQCKEVKEKFTISPKYNYKLLEEYCNKNNITLTNHYENENLNAHYLIQGQCSNDNCSNMFKKRFYKLIQKIALCNSCVFKKAKEVRKNTNLAAVGCENYFQNEEIKNKIKKNNLQKYGVEHISQNQEIKQKIKDTCLKKYGVEHPSYDKNVQNKITQTNLNKYGVEHLMKDPNYLENMLKKSHKFKEYIFPSGRIDKIQGYEHFALNELIINEKINESDIITGCKNVPEIWYHDEHTIKRRHFVDIFIPSQNRCIEVKSEWTFTKPNILIKQKAAKNLGYNYEIWVYDKKGNKTCYD
jgi:hypothetical protein